MDERTQGRITILQTAQETLRAERQAITLSLHEAPVFLESVTRLVDHQEKIEAIDRIIADEKALAKPPYTLEHVLGPYGG